jgi:single-strand DNA-binding protein
LADDRAFAKASGIGGVSALKQTKEPIDPGMSWITVARGPMKRAKAAGPCKIETSLRPVFAICIGGKTMAGSVNKVILVGNIGRDPEVRRTGAGDPVVSFSLATSESWRDKASGERKERTEWHNIVIFNENLGKIAEQYCKKGTKIYLEGQLQTREYTDRDGNQRKATEVVLTRFRGELTLLDSRSRGEDTGAGGTFEGSTPSSGRSPPMDKGAERRPASGPSRAADIIDDDIPF